MEFVRRGWRWAGESGPFQKNFNVEMIAEHLEAVANHRILRLAAQS